MTDLEKILIGAIVGGAVMLVGKIIWSWINGRNGEDRRKNDNGRCIYHAELSADIKEQSREIKEIKEDVGYIKGKLSILCKHIGE